MAVDHGFFNERSFLQGIENLDAAVQTLVEADPDAIQLTVGQARLCSQIPGKQKPALCCARMWPMCTALICLITCSAA